MGDSIPENLVDAIETALVDYDKDGRIFGSSGAGAFFLADHLAKSGAFTMPAVLCAHDHPAAFADAWDGLMDELGDLRAARDRVRDLVETARKHAGGPYTAAVDALTIERAYEGRWAR
ncbi:hypothetical protein GUY44_07580 [Pimelobacter simplex]|uniref:Uncharacterized protein n=1 Tax=Nocardioides simplex TaxID=2045 RepID=A0A0A1DH05_NOCSI|nr:hypothetical protein [Pimelobacter simplex]AIY15813.1 hypothetical protein KR76_01795 [Pimelobacter simplex]MCG8150335.1 hypothetical protein [Pimelobacter simplex]GEB16701.1 hypothetical protein NSI01_50160 [Pimelobacter simplex]SFM89806.1 hypothetical protein SAMN05421671_4083 [Pimelobacter simplex]